MTDDRRERWEKAAEWPLMAAALLFLLAYAWPILDPALAAPWPTVFGVMTAAAWSVFAVDYLMRLRMSTQRARFVRTHLLDLAVVVLPLLRPLRMLRLVTLLTVLNRYAGSALRGRVTVYVGGATALVLFVAALAALEAERGAPESTIQSFGDAFWWAVATVTTVGYGDHYPVTTTGRMVAVGLMLAGIGLLGIVTATLATWLIERVEQVEEKSQAATRRDIEALAAEVEALRQELSAKHN